MRLIDSTRRPVGRLLAALAIVLTAVSVMAPAASAHNERKGDFPDGSGEVPTYRPFDSGAPRLVVCKADSAARIAEITDPVLKAQDLELLGECGFEHIQAAVDAVTTQGTNIYVLPGVYREEPSIDAPCAADYDGGLVTYEHMYECGEVVNLVTIAGDDPADADAKCRNPITEPRCYLQIEGMGESATDVLLKGGFRPNGDWIKHNGIKADRADGIYLKNFTAELFRENAIYVHETDGYRLDGVVGRHNDLYGILTFTADHGVIENCETYNNGDSGIYPGSPADVNKDSTSAWPPISRWAVEIRNCETHHNALGFSGTAGSSVFFHDNLVHDNGAGYVTDSFVGGHPGMPQDHARLENNLIYSNNSNYYTQYVHSGICARPVAERGYETGTVCPAFPVPVGTGVMIAGGSYNLVRNNEIFDNWRNGVMFFWVPGAIREDFSPEAQYDTSHGNRMLDNRLGFHPAGVTQPNGTDFWWDDQGIGNCWEGNVSATGTVTTNALVPLLPTCDVGSVGTGNPVKSATLVPCAVYNREDNNDPPGCDWFDSPAPPAGRQEAPTELASSVLLGGALRDVGAPGTVDAVVPPTIDTGRPILVIATGPFAGIAVAGLVLPGAAVVVTRRRKAA